MQTTPVGHLYSNSVFLCDVHTRLCASLQKHVSLLKARCSCQIKSEKSKKPKKRKDGGDFASFHHEDLLGAGALTQEAVAWRFCETLPALPGFPSIFLYMACSAPLWSEFFFTSLDSSAWMVFRKQTRPKGNRQREFGWPRPRPWEAAERSARERCGDRRSVNHTRNH